MYHTILFCIVKLGSRTPTGEFKKSLKNSVGGRGCGEEAKWREGKRSTYFVNQKVLHNYDNEILVCVYLKYSQF